jgi:multidrug efflux pump subunit AcrB
MIFIYLGFGRLSLNIYTEVGLVTLMGLVSKHGILIVEVANEARLPAAQSLRLSNMPPTSDSVPF